MNPPFADALLDRAVLRHERAAGGVAPLSSLRLAGLERVLVVLTTGLGDTVLSTPVFAALRAALPRARIVLFVRAAWAGLFAHDPDLDGVVSYPGKYRRFFRTLRALRAHAPQLGVVLHGNDPDIIPLVFLAGSRHIVRIPVSGTRYARLLSNRSRAEDAATVPGLHYIENRLRILDTLGIAATDRVPRVVLADADRAHAVQVLRSLMPGDAPYWVYHPGAADPYKCWPQDSSRQLLEAACARHADHAIVLTGAPAERASLSALAAGLPADRVVVAAGRCSLVETAGIVAGARCVVAPDTGMLHLAAALDRPVVGLYAPTSASLVGPRAARARVITLQRPLTCTPCLEKRCPYVPRHCMRQIGVPEAVEALDAQLASA